MNNILPELQVVVLGLFRRLDLILASAGIGAAAIQLARGIANGSIISLLFGVFSLVPCAFWLLMRAPEQPVPGLRNSSRRLFFLFTIGFWVLFIASLLVLYQRLDPYLRPPSYLVAVALMAGVLACEALCSARRTSWPILLQIILLGILISWSQVVNYSGMVGMDPWFHQMFTNHLIENHHLAEDYYYAHFPIFHLLIGQTAILTGLDYKVATLFSVSLVQIVCNVLFVYLFAVTIFRNQVVGVLAALMVILSPYHIYMSYWSIPNGFAAIFIMIALYLIFHRREGSPVFAMLLGLFLGTLILTHTISALCMAIVLFVAWGASTFHRRFYVGGGKNCVPFFLPIIFTATMLAWWFWDTTTMGTLSGLLAESFNFHYFQVTGAPAGLMDYVLAPVEVAYNNLGLFLPLFFSLIGIFSMIMEKGTSRQFVAAFIGLAPFGITISAFVIGIAIIPDRWFYFSGLLLGGPLALAILLMGGPWITRRKIISLVIPVLIVTVFAFLAITNPIADHWDPLISPNSTRTALFESEIDAFHTVAGFSQSPIKTDRYYAMSQKWVRNVTIPFDDEIYPRDYGRLAGYLVLVRGIVEDGPFTLYSVPYRLDYSLDSDLSSAGFSQVYDSPTVRGYLLQR